MTARTRTRLLIVQWTCFAVMVLCTAVNVALGAWPAALFCGFIAGMALTLGIITHATEPRR